MTPDLKYDASIRLDSAALPWQPYAPSGYPAGLTMRVLRRLDSGLLRSAVLDLPAGWSSGGPLAGSAREQSYVLSGALRIGATLFEPGSFYVRPAGRPFGPISTDTGARLVVILDGEQAFDAAADQADPDPNAIDHLVAEEIEPFEPVIDGRTIGVKRRVLWDDPVSGADTRHLTMPAGLSGLGAEWHPVNEEIFCLTREPGPVYEEELQVGWYLFNPAFAVHGGKRRERPCATTLLEWHDGKWELNRP